MKKTNDIKSFIFQCFRAEKQIRVATFHLFHKFSRIFDILRRIKSVLKVRVQIMYKRKTQKTNSVDVNIFDESKFETNSKWRKILKSFVTVDSLKQLKKLYDSFLISKFSKMSRDSRMISKWLQKMLFNAKLSFQERNLLIEMLYKRKTVLIWNFSEIDKVRSKIMKDQKTYIISHKTWQIFDFSVSKTLKLIIIKMLQKRINADFLEFNFNSYKNFWFLINKKIKNKYRMINAIMNMNEIIIRDVNLSLNVKKFSKEFADMLITSLINFFFDYDQMMLVEKCRDLTTFMTSFELLKIIKCSQKIINSIV